LYFINARIINKSGNGKDYRLRREEKLKGWQQRERALSDCKRNYCGG
jgi:hypothetical protein